jgi:hydroxylysine kinase
MHALETVAPMLDKIAHPVDLHEVKSLMNRHHGLDCALQVLSGERDYNFLATTPQGEQWIVKIAHDDEQEAVLEFQSQVLQRIVLNAPHIPVAAERPDVQGHCVTKVVLRNGTKRLMRVNRFLPGASLCNVPRNATTRTAVGTLAAELAKALKGFSHPAEKRVLLWDIQQAPALAHLVDALPPKHLAAAKNLTTHFMQTVAHDATGLPWSVIHNDLNLHNILLDKQDHARIVGCIDFGDMLYAPRVNDLAIAAAYQLDLADPLQSIAEMAKAYARVNPLQAAEVDQLVERVAVRCVLTLAITHWRSKLHPENAAYILRNAASAGDGLDALQNISPVMARECLYDQLAMNQGAVP